MNCGKLGMKLLTEDDEIKFLGRLNNSLTEYSFLDFNNCFFPITEEENSNRETKITAPKIIKPERQIVWLFLRHNEKYKNDFDRLSEIDKQNAVSSDESAIDLADDWELFARSYFISRAVDYRELELPDDIYFFKPDQIYTSLDPAIKNIRSTSVFFDYIGKLVSYQMGNTGNNDSGPKPLLLVCNPTQPFELQVEKIRCAYEKSRTEALRFRYGSKNSRGKEHSIQKMNISQMTKINQNQLKILDSPLLEYLFWTHLEKMPKDDSKNHSDLKMIVALKKNELNAVLKVNVFGHPKQANHEKLNQPRRLKEKLNYSKKFSECSPWIFFIEND
jgi:hypothetical protein